MGYSTDFFGHFDLDKPLLPAHREYIKKFGDTRRMRRDTAKAAMLPDPVREAVGLPVGPEGAYFVGGGGWAGQGQDISIVDNESYNSPPGLPHYRLGQPWEEYQAEVNKAITDNDAQPSLWCQWAPSEDGKTIMWDGSEKFYYYIEWLKYLIKHFLGPWGYTLNGEVWWQGESADDIGVIKVVDNEVRVGAGRIVYDEPVAR